MPRRLTLDGAWRVEKDVNQRLLLTSSLGCETQLGDIMTEKRDSFRRSLIWWVNGKGKPSITRAFLLKWKSWTMVGRRRVDWDRYLLTLVIKARKCMCLYRNSYKALSKIEASFRRPIFGILGVKAKLWLLAQRPPRLQGEDQAGLESGFCVSSQPRFLHTLIIAHFSVIMGCWMWLCRQQGLCMGSCSGHG